MVVGGWCGGGNGQMQKTENHQEDLAPGEVKNSYDSYILPYNIHTPGNLTGAEVKQ